MKFAKVSILAISLVLPLSSALASEGLYYQIDYIESFGSDVPCAEAQCLYKSIKSTSFYCDFYVDPKSDAFLHPVDDQDDKRCGIEMRVENGRPMFGVKRR